MTHDIPDLTLLALPLSLVCQWWLLRRRWMGRVLDAQARHARYKARAEVLIAITKQRLHGLQQQLYGNKPKPARPAERYPLAQARARRQRSAPVDAQLIVVDEDGASVQLPPAGPNAFVDTVSGF